MRRLSGAAFLVLTTLAMALSCGCKSGTAVKSPTPDVTHLLNGRNLGSFDTVLDGKGTDNDPDTVFSLVDGMLRISGQHAGYLATKKEYMDFKLVAEFKWGDATWTPRQFKARESGILINAVENGQGLPTAIECEIIEGGTGSIVLLPGASLTMDGVKKGPDGGRFDRPGRKPWKDELGFRGTDEIEKPHGEWNTLEIICAGGEVGIALNGNKILAGTGAKPDQGKIMLRSKGAEVFFRKLDLYPLR